jgi:hypothetical protein
LDNVLQDAGGFVAVDFIFLPVSAQVSYQKESKA